MKRHRLSPAPPQLYAEQMDDEPSIYRGGVTFAGQWGCIAAFLFAAVMLVPALLLAPFGDCLFERTCDRGGADVFITFLVLLLVPAALFGWSVRALIDWWRDPSTGSGRAEGEIARRRPLGATVVAVVSVALAGWFVLREFTLFSLFGW